MKNATFPTCPIDNCPGTFRYSHVIKTRDGWVINEYHKCDTCDEQYSAARKATPAEKAQKKAEKAAKKARKTQKQMLAEYKAERERLNALPQLPVKGWHPGDWFPELKVETGQMRMIL